MSLVILVILALLALGGVGRRKMLLRCMMYKAGGQS
jgi:hypothetical protein